MVMIMCAVLMQSPPEQVSPGEKRGCAWREASRGSQGPEQLRGMPQGSTIRKGPGALALPLHPSYPSTHL